jgi:SagB-type dehydrogenase family enzyme
MLCDSNSVESATQTLHRLTSVERFDEERALEPPVDDPAVVQGFTPMDLHRLPWFYKRYHDGPPRIDLPRRLTATTAGAVDVLAGTAYVPRAQLGLSELGRLLFLMSGVTRTSQRPFGRWLFRAAGSAGGRFPLEVYVAVPEGSSLPSGVHWYQPEQHALLTVGPAPTGGCPAVVVTGVPWRTGWKYRERGYRHVHWDAGTALSQLLAAASSAGIPAHLYTRFPDAAVAELVGADGVHEWPVAVVALGNEDPAIDAAGPAVGGRVDDDPVEFPLVTAAKRAGDMDTLGAPWLPGPPVRVPLPGGDPVERVILRRGSQRLMDPTQPLSADLLRTALAAALRGIDVPHWVAAHQVTGVACGLYRSPDLATPVRTGDLRQEMYHACMDQGLGRDAAFVVIAATEIAAATDRDYREAQLAAGLVEGRLHLVAYALGVAASGMTFADGLVPRLLGQGSMQGLLFTCIGVPEYPSKPGGPPGDPSAVQMVTPRF